MNQLESRVPTLASFFGPDCVLRLSVFDLACARLMESSMAETAFETPSVRATLRFNDGQCWPLPVYVNADIHGDIPELLISPRDTMSEVVAGKWLLLEVGSDGVVYRQLDAH
jgi:hypothetical protein